MKNNLYNPSHPQWEKRNLLIRLPETSLLLAKLFRMEGNFVAYLRLILVEQVQS